MKPAEVLTPDEWAQRYRTYGPETGKPGPRDPWLTAYQIPFIRKIHDRTHRRVVAVTAAQSGKTEGLMDAIGARLDQRPAPIIYVGPSRDFVSDQFEPRLMALLDEAPSLAAKVVRGRRMKKTLKWVSGVRLRLASAGSSTALKSDPAALGIADEYDEMTANIKGQGDPLGLLEARGETYADFVAAVVSTPSQGTVETEIDPVNGLEMWATADPDLVESPIWRLFQSGTRHHFAWPCPHCDGYFIPMRKHLTWPKGSTPAQARRAATLVCPHCGAHIDEGPEGATKQDMIRRGVQVAPGQTIEEAMEGINEPDVSTWSCWTSGLCSPFVTWGERAERYLSALATGEPDKLQTVLNANFGECASPIGATDKPEWSEVQERALPYAEGDVPSGVLRLVMGVDVQKFSIFYVIRGYGERGSSWLVTSGQLFGPTDQDDVWAALADLFLNPVGGMMIERVGVDSGFRPDKPNAGSEHKVYEFCRRYNWLCVPTKGKDQQNPPLRFSKIEVKKDGKKASYSLNLAWLSTDFFKSLVMSKIHAPLGAPGAFHVHSDITEDYCRQVTSEVRTVVEGKPKWNRLSKANHFLDCEAIAEGMAYSLNVQRIPEGVRRIPDEPDGHPREEDRPVANRIEATAPVQPEAAISRRNRFAGLAHRMNR